MRVSILKKKKKSVHIQSENGQWNVVHSFMQNTHAGRHIPTHACRNSYVLILIFESVLWYMYSHRRNTFLFSFVWILERFRRTDDVLMIKKWQMRKSYITATFLAGFGNVFVGWAGDRMGIFIFYFCWRMALQLFSCLSLFVACGILLDPAHDWEGSRPPLPNPSVIVVNQEESVPVKKEGNRHTGATGKEKENKKSGAG